MKLFTAYEHEKLGVFIDGANLYASARALDFDIDYRALLKWLREAGRLTRTSYYTTLIDDNDFSPIRPLIDWLDYNGYHMITKPAREYTDSSGRRKVKGSMHVDLAVDMMDAANTCDHIMLFSGDGDFLSLVKAVQSKGTRVTVVSTIASSTPMISDDLRRTADCFLDLNDMQSVIKRKDSAGNNSSQKNTGNTDDHGFVDEDGDEGDIEDYIPRGNVYEDQ